MTASQATGALVIVAVPGVDYRLQAVETCSEQKNGPAERSGGR